MSFTTLIQSQPLDGPTEVPVLTKAPQSRVLLTTLSGAGVWPGSPNMTIDMDRTVSAQKRALIINTAQNCEVAVVPRGTAATSVVAVPIQVVTGGTASYSQFIVESSDVYVRAL